MQSGYLATFRYDLPPSCNNRMVDFRLCSVLCIQVAKFYLYSKAMRFRHVLCAFVSFKDLLKHIGAVWAEHRAVLTVPRLKPVLRCVLRQKWKAPRRPSVVSPISAYRFFLRKMQNLR